VALPKREGAVTLGTCNVLRVVGRVTPCRVPHPTDRRSSVLELTDAGRDALSRSRSEVSAGLEEFFSKVPARDVEEFGRILADPRSVLSEE